MTVAVPRPHLMIAALELEGSDLVATIEHISAGEYCITTYREPLPAMTDYDFLTYFQLAHLSILDRFDEQYPYQET